MESIVSVKAETPTSVRVEVQKQDSSSVVLLIELGSLSQYTENNIFSLSDLLPSKERKSRAVSGKEDQAAIELYFKSVGAIIEKLITEKLVDNDIKNIIANFYSRASINMLAKSDESQWKDAHLAICAMFAPDLTQKTQLYFDNEDQTEWNYPRVKPDTAICLPLKGELAARFKKMACMALKVNLLPLVVGESKRMLLNNVSGTPVKPDGAIREARLYAYIILNWVQVLFPDIADKAIVVSIAQVGPYHQVMWNTIKGARKFETEVAFSGVLSDDMDDKLLQNFNATVAAGKTKVGLFAAELAKYNA